MLKRLMLIVLLLPTALVAGERNDLPSCYDFVKLGNMRPAVSGRELILIIDETTQLSDEIKTSAFNHVMRFISPGDSLRLYRISAFMPNSFLQLEYAATLENQLEGSVRDNVGMATLKSLDKCLTAQQAAFRNEIVKKMSSSFGNENKTIAKSEILFSLLQISKDNQHQAAAQHVLLMVSDMLENSDFSSFYSKNSVRDIDPELEMKKVEKNNLTANLEGWRVYVEAAGLVPHDIKDGYRSGKTIQRLEQFWSSYFKSSGAALVGFGAPMLTMELN